MLDGLQNGNVCRCDKNDFEDRLERTMELKSITEFEKSLQRSECPRRHFLFTSGSCGKLLPEHISTTPDKVVLCCIVGKSRKAGQLYHRLDYRTLLLEDKRQSPQVVRSSVILSSLAKCVHNAAASENQTSLGLLP